MTPPFFFFPSFFRYFCLPICFHSDMDMSCYIEIEFHLDSLLTRIQRWKAENIAFPESSLLIVIPCPIEMRSGFCLHSTSVVDRYCREN